MKMIKVCTAGATLCIAALAASSAAQTVNQIPKFQTSTTFSDSPISVSGSNVGIGTTPTSTTQLQTSGAVGIGGDAFYGHQLSVHGSLVTSGLDIDASSGGWETHVSTEGLDPGANPTAAALHIANGYGGRLLDILNDGYLRLGQANGAVQIQFARGSDGAYAGSLGYASATEASNFQLISYGGGGILTFGTGGSGTEKMRIDVAGNVGIGTTDPHKKLHIAGDVEIDGSLYFGSNATPQSASYAGVSCTGADYAEAIDVTGDRTTYEPGDVLVIDPSAPGKFLKANQAYSTLVAGIYSTRPGFVGRKEPPTPESAATEVPMAMVGRVPTKVSSEGGPIKVGDLLVTSSTPGYAMKGTDRSRMLGAVVGKALGPLDSDTGVIEVLVTLQ